METTSDPELFKHIVCIFTIYQITSSIRVIKCLTFGLIGDGNIEGQSFS